MEHRWEQRLPLRVVADVHGSDVRFWTRNIGNWGAFIETCGDQLPDGHHLHTILHDESTGVCCATLNLYVVHHTGDGVGVMVMDRVSSLALAQFVRAATGRATPKHAQVPTASFRLGQHAVRT